MRPLIFNTISALFSHYSLFKKNQNQWRLTEPVEGQIHGLPNSHGLLLATDGILCLLQREGFTQLFQGHLDWFEPWKPTIRTINSKDNSEVFEVGKKVRQKNAEARAVKITQELLTELLEV